MAGHLVFVQRTQTAGLGPETKKRKNEIRTVTQTRFESAGATSDSTVLVLLKPRGSLAQAQRPQPSRWRPEKDCSVGQMMIDLAFQVAKSSEEKTVHTVSISALLPGSAKILQNGPSADQAQALLRLPVHVNPLPLLTTSPDPQSGVNIYLADI